MLPALQNIPIDKSMNTIGYMKICYLGLPWFYSIIFVLSYKQVCTRSSNLVFLSFVFPEPTSPILPFSVRHGFFFRCISKKINKFLIRDVTANNLVIFIDSKAVTKVSTFCVTAFGMITSGNPFNNGPNISEIESTNVNVV